MGKKSKSDQWLEDLRNQSAEKSWQLGIGFVECLKIAVETSGGSLEAHMGTLCLFFELLKDQLRSPYQFEPYHQKIRHPIDYYQFSLDFIRPLIEEKGSKVLGQGILDKIERQIEAGENVVFYANHQTETDPQAIAILLQKTHPKLAEEIIYVAGERVVTDPLAIPFSMGTNLLCIYSKRYIDYPLELKAQKMLHNKNTMELMSRLLQEGGKAIYVAPSGGRDRRDATGAVFPAPFDPNSVEMFYLMAKKAKEAIHSALGNKIKIRITKSHEETQEFWVVRRESFNLLRKHTDGMRTAPFIDDFSVRVEKLPEFLPKLYEVLDERRAVRDQHCGDGRRRHASHNAVDWTRLGTSTGARPERNRHQRRGTAYSHSRAGSAARCRSLQEEVSVFAICPPSARPKETATNLTGDRGRCCFT